MKTTLKTLFVSFIAVLLMAMPVQAQNVLDQGQVTCSQWKQQCVANSTSPACKQYRLLCAGKKTDPGFTIRNNTPFQVRLVHVYGRDHRTGHFMPIAPVVPPFQIEPKSRATFSDIPWHEGHRFEFQFDGGFKATNTRTGETPFVYRHLRGWGEVKGNLVTLNTGNFQFGLFDEQSQDPVARPQDGAIIFRPTLGSNSSFVSFLKGPFSDLTLTNQTGFPVTVFQAQIAQDPNRIAVAQQVNLNDTLRDERLWHLATLQPGESKILHATLGVGLNHILALPSKEAGIGGKLFLQSVTINNLDAKTFEMEPKSVVITAEHFY